MSEATEKVRGWEKFKGFMKRHKVKFLVGGGIVAAMAVTAALAKDEEPDEPLYLPPSGDLPEIPVTQDSTTNRPCVEFNSLDELKEHMEFIYNDAPGFATDVKYNFEAVEIPKSDVVIETHTPAGSEGA